MQPAPRLAQLPLLLLLAAGSASAQVGGPQPVAPTTATTAQSRGQAPQVPPSSVSDLARRYVAPDSRPLEIRQATNTNLVTGLPNDASERRSIELDIAFNIKYWHIALGASMSCNQRLYDVSSIRLEAVHFYDQGSRATAYYTAQLRPQGIAGGAVPATDGDEGCREASAELIIVRLIDDELYAVDWGRRLVRRR